MCSNAGANRATVSYFHMHTLVELHGQPGWVATLTPFSVDGMIVAASTTLLADSRSAGRGGFLPWALLVIGSVASLAADVAVAEPSTASRVIAAWPSTQGRDAWPICIRVGLSLVVDEPLEHVPNWGFGPGLVNLICLSRSHVT
jgi:hypothetical protein